MKESTFKGYKDYPIHLYEWDEVDKPKAVVQLVHGMVEHLGRYDDFAKYLNSKGYIVLGDDHRAHGKTSGKEKQGFVPEGDCYFDTLEDLAKITDYAKEKYNLPVYLFGHSYGSFLSQGYIQKYADKIEAVILCGSAKQKGIDVATGRVVANVQTAFCGKDAKANLIKKLTFDVYDKKFTPRMPGGWVNRDANEVKKYLNDEFCAYTCSLGFYKSFFNALKEIYKKKNLANVPQNLPIFIISGSKDPVGKDGKLVVKLYDMYKELGVKNVQMKLYEGARHEILNELCKQEVYDDVVKFIQDCEK